MGKQAQAAVVQLQDGLMWGFSLLLCLWVFGGVWGFVCLFSKALLLLHSTYTFPTPASPIYGQANAVNCQA